jgi:hypothetical protein
MTCCRAGALLQPQVLVSFILVGDAGLDNTDVTWGLQPGMQLGPWRVGSSVAVRRAAGEPSDSSPPRKPSPLSTMSISRFVVCAASVGEH